MSSLLEKLETVGYAVMQTDDLAGYERTARELGSITQKLDVRITPEKTQYANMPEAVPFHTDHPEIPFVAWHCLRQDDDDGANILLDSRLVTSQLSAGERAVLRKMTLRKMHRDTLQPVLSDDPYQVYWLPVIIGQALADATAEQVEVICRLSELIDVARDNGIATSVRLDEGEALFVNNRALLHSREAIKPTSERHLVRYYIKPS